METKQLVDTLGYWFVAREEAGGLWDPYTKCLYMSKAAAEEHAHIYAQLNPGIKFGVLMLDAVVCQQPDTPPTVLQ